MIEEKASIVGHIGTALLMWSDKRRPNGERLPTIDCYHAAQAVLAAIAAQGLVLVPAEPTQAMKQVAFDMVACRDGRLSVELFGRVWAAMLAAVKPPADET